MGKYCDTRLLEKIWSRWLLVKDTPDLEPLRRGLLWSKRSGDHTTYTIAVSHPFSFSAIAGRIDDSDILAALSMAVMPIDEDIANRLANDNYTREAPARASWDELALMIYSICLGVALNFNPASDDIRLDLAHEALRQTLLKIHRGKLRYTAGRAPVFNLLTTAITRIMLSIKNKEKRSRDNQNRLTSELINGTPLPSFRSLNLSRSSLRAATDSKTSTAHQGTSIIGQ